jgi:hypothetical protein
MLYLSRCFDQTHVSCRQPVGLIELSAEVEHVLQGKTVAVGKLILTLAPLCITIAMIRGQGQANA